MNSNVRLFINEISDISENDFGDFMRSANSHLDHLEKSLDQFYNRDINQKIIDMKMYLQYSPNWDIESTRKRLLQDANALDELINDNNSNTTHSEVHL